MSQIVGDLETTSKLLMGLESFTLHLPLLVVKTWWNNPQLFLIDEFCHLLKACLIWALILLLKDHFEVNMLKMDAICPTIVGFYKQNCLFIYKVFFIALVESITKMKKMM
jgi:CDP-diglyceride synthetase